MITFLDFHLPMLNRHYSPVVIYIFFSKVKFTFFLCSSTCHILFCRPAVPRPCLAKSFFSLNCCVYLVFCHLRKTTPLFNFKILDMLHVRVGGRKKVCFRAGKAAVTPAWFRTSWSVLLACYGAERSRRRRWVASSSRR